MGAGNYYFQSPSSDDWATMVYVDLEPRSWADEVEERARDFVNHLSSLDARFKEKRIDPTSIFIEAKLSKLREAWYEENFPGTLSSESFYEDQSQLQLESIIDALYGAFKQPVSMPNDRNAETIENATILTRVGRMVVAGAYTYHGDRLAIIVTPNEETHELLWKWQNDKFHFETSGRMPYRSERLAHNAMLANFRRSYQSGALGNEMEEVRLKVMVGLIEAGLLDSMSIRTCASASARFVQSGYFQDVLMPWFKKKNPVLHAAVIRANPALAQAA